MPQPAEHDHNGIPDCWKAPIQQEPFKGSKVHCNAQMNARLIKKHCELDAAGHRMLELAGSEAIHELHLAEAIQYRSLDRKIPS